MYLECCQDDKVFKTSLKPARRDDFYYFVLPSGNMVPADSPDDVLVVEKVKV